MNIILFDDEHWTDLLPLTFTRPLAAIRVGISTIAEKWEYYTKAGISYSCQDYLAEKFPISISDDNILVNGALIPDQQLVDAIRKLRMGEMLVKDSSLLGIRINRKDTEEFSPGNKLSYPGKEYEGNITMVERPWQIFQMCGEMIRRDFNLFTEGRPSSTLSKTNNVIGTGDLFVEKGASAEYATINTETGPVYLGKNSEIMEGSIIRGPFCLGDHSVVRMGAKIYGPTSIGPHSKVGGEVNNCVIFGYSNKAHDGFLGNSVLGEWCNIGADSNNSNLKNNYAEVRLWSYREERFINTGLQFCGLIMGDHSKCGINTMFNTGTVIGINTNIYGAGFPRNFIPSFTWGSASKFTTYSLPKAFDVAEKVMARRNIEFTDTDKSIFREIFEKTSKYRN